MRPTLSDYDGVSREDHYVHLRGVTWQDYERLLEIRGESAVPRYTYLEGELEIMSPSRTHEWVKSIIGRLVEVWCLERDVEFSTFGSWTLTDQQAECGAEPDECYIFGDSVHVTRPHLAIEVVWTHGGINKLEVYRKLGVPELWYWSRGRIQPYELVHEQYQAVDAGKVLDGIDLRQLERFVDSPSTSHAIREYRKALTR
ncbi:MAG TPA: Uma2 family endonuclease [Polyangiaceae bacterium]|nr:Uma2 family endonuclease [Polyangiaceae bacterium]